MPKVSSSARAGLIFPIGKLHRKLKTGFYADRISVGASIYMSAILEYLTAEILELAREVAVITGEDIKTRISPRFIQLAIRGDEELDKLFADITIAEGGVLPYIEAALLKNITIKMK